MKTKKQHYENLNVNNVMDNQTFWKTVKPYFSDKGSNFNQITLLKIDIASVDFSFQEVSREDIKIEIINLNLKKCSTSWSNPATILNQCLQVLYLLFLTKAINQTITAGA